MAYETKTERLYGQLRDCYSGGYTLPQYCLEHEIKHPLIVSNRTEWLWETYVQFRYDNRIDANVASIDSANEVVNISPACVLGALRITSLLKMDTAGFDTVFILKEKENFPANVADKLAGKKVIYLNVLVSNFVQHVYAEIPLYHYVKKHPNVKVIALNVPFLNKKNHIY